MVILIMCYEFIYFQYLHERNILHRDLKTQNIFVTKSKIIKVGDLGIARYVFLDNYRWFFSLNKWIMSMTFNKLSVLSFIYEEYTDN